MSETHKLSREEMIHLVTRIVAADGTEEEIDRMIEVFDANCVNPRKSDLIFWPHGIPHDATKKEPTIEEIVDAALTASPTSKIRL